MVKFKYGENYVGESIMSGKAEQTQHIKNIFV